MGEIPQEVFRTGLADKARLALVHVARQWVHRADSGLRRQTRARSSPITFT